MTIEPPWGADPYALIGLELVIPRPTWQTDAACRGVGVDKFIADRGITSYSEALTICAGCPSLIECRRFAIEHEEQMPGVWGGLTPSALRAARRARPKDPT